MTTYTNVPNSDVDQDSPITQPLLTALRDNPTATVEGASGAPYAFLNWHPYDGVSVGGSEAGEIYNSATDGAVGSVVTPDFVDGYEYGLILDGFGSNSGTDGTLDFTVTFDDATTMVGTISPLGTLGARTGAVAYLNSRVRRQAFASTVLWQFATTGGTSGNATPSTVKTAANATKILKFTITPADGSIALGRLLLIRRRDYLSDIV